MSFKYELLNKNSNNPIQLGLSPKNEHINDVKRDLPVIQFLAMKKAESFNTITDMFNYYYNDMAKYKLQKADDPFLTSTIGVINPTYGQEVIPQFNLESNGIALEDKRPYNKMGIRVQTARAFSTASGALGEGLTVPIPDSVLPTYQLVKVPLKTIAHVVNWSMQVAIKSRFDDSIMIPGNIKTEMMAEHVKCQNEMLFTANTVAPGNAIQSLRGLISSYDEINTYGYTAGNVDPWGTFSGITRGGGTSWADSNVILNSTGPVDVTLDMLNNMIRLSQTYDPEGFNPNNYYFLTNLNQRDKISDLLQPQQRFTNQTRVTIAQNGVERTGNAEGGFNVISWKDIPIFTSVDAPDEIYLINKKHLFFNVAMPPMAFDYGLLSRGDPSGLNALGDETLLISVLEQGCDNFRVQTKAMNLTA